jgi:hypothetical protein
MFAACWGGAWGRRTTASRPTVACSPRFSTTYCSHLHDPSSTPMEAAGLTLSESNNARSEWRFVESGAYSTVGAAGKGIGGFALRKHRCGERVLAELPLLEWVVESGEPVTQAGLERAVGRMSEPSRVAFFGLMQARMYGPTKTPWGVWQSNAYPCTGADLQSSAIFAQNCRLNHSCLANSHLAWNPQLGRQTLHVLRDVEPGDELTVSYCNGNGQVRAERQSYLAEHFGFECTCALCSLRGTALEESDARQQRVGSLFGEIREAFSAAAAAARAHARAQQQQPGRGGRTPFTLPASLVALVEERLALKAAEGMVDLGDNVAAHSVPRSNLLVCSEDGLPPTAVYCMCMRVCGR